MVWFRGFDALALVVLVVPEYRIGAGLPCPPASSSSNLARTRRRRRRRTRKTPVLYS
jgi:hypothetical protein